MSNYNFETVPVSQGAYVGWAPKPGQVVTGKVLSYEPNGATNFNGDPCPQVALELVEDAYSVNKDGERYDFPAGEFVTITAGQANLKRGIVAAQLEVGDVVRIEYTDTQKTANGTVKLFAIKVARGAGKSAPKAEAAPPF